jgi:hypothetical protein
MLNILSRVWRLYKTEFGLSTGFIGLHSVTHLQPITTESLTITTDSHN